MLLLQIGKNTHFWKINIFTKTAICIPKSLNMHSEWGNIKECNKYRLAILNIRGRGGQKKEFVHVFVPIPNTIVHNCLLCTKMHHLVSFQHESFVFALVLLHCHVWRVTDSLCFVYLVYILPSKSPNGILLIKPYFQIKITNNLQCV